MRTAARPIKPRTDRAETERAASTIKIPPLRRWPKHGRSLLFTPIIPGPGAADKGGRAIVRGAQDVYKRQAVVTAEIAPLKEDGRPVAGAVHAALGDDFVDGRSQHKLSLIHILYSQFLLWEFVMGFFVSV